MTNFGTVSVVAGFFHNRLVLAGKAKVMQLLMMTRLICICTVQRKQGVVFGVTELFFFFYCICIYDVSGFLPNHSFLSQKHMVISDIVSDVFYALVLTHHYFNQAFSGIWGQTQGQG